MVGLGDQMMAEEKFHGMVTRRRTKSLAEPVGGVKAG